MRALAFAALVMTACNYDPQRFGVEVDAPAGSDGAVGMPDAPAGMVWTVIETIMVDSANPNAEVSTSVLANGVTYKLRASGVLSNVIDPFPGDAEYFDFDNPKDNGCCEDIGLGIDDVVVNDLDTKPDWGPYRVDHVYEAMWVGKGTTITALYQDTLYSNNVGTLTLEILELR
jgi:hypothetical protein